MMTAAKPSSTTFIPWPACRVVLGCEAGNGSDRKKCKAAARNIFECGSSLLSNACASQRTTASRNKFMDSVGESGMAQVITKQVASRVARTASEIFSERVREPAAAGVSSEMSLLGTNFQAKFLLQ